MITKETLYELLPAIYRKKDQELGKPLESLFDVISKQANIIESDIGELYDNWFIETCKKWVIPYVGDLLGVQNIDTPIRNFSQRALVANQIAQMRRKGTLHSLEQIARDVTGWDTRAVEFFQLLPVTQNLNNLNLKNKTVDLHQTNELELVDSPFDTMCHTLDTRTIQDNKGWHNIQNIGLFFWRLQTFPIVDSTAFNHKDGKFSFDPLGNDIKLYNNPITEQSISHIAKEKNLPHPIRRKSLKNNFYDYYGDDMSINIESDGTNVDSDEIIVSNLTDWENRPREGMIAVDPELGRILFPKNQIPKKVRVSYYYAFSGNLGSNPYERDDSILSEKFGSENIQRYYIIKNEKIREKHSLLVTDDADKELRIFSTLSDAINDWQSKTENPSNAAIFEIMDSEVYDEPISTLVIKSGMSLEIRSKMGQRPLLKFENPLTIKSDKQKPNTNHESILVLDGLLISSNPESKEPESLFHIENGDLRFLHVRQCTLVPNSKNQKSIDLPSGNERLTVEIKNSIVGRIHLGSSDAKLNLTNSIIDGQKSNGHSDSISCYELSVKNCTIIGDVHTNILTLAKNSIFTNSLNVKRRQQGIVKFCYLHSNLKAPRCYKCIMKSSDKFISDENVSLSTNLPNFTSLRYDAPGYAQLDIHNTPKEILEGAENLQEIGAFNFLNQTSRINNFKSSLAKYLPFGKETAILYVS
ncbi:MAG: phage tail protein [Nitrosopumilus sp.]|nr:phage tail protein [Nitrosopumilus sp.]MDH3735406.1 phage tail protein [Nitrosopumilus sp.]MDH3822232.1 phage tail protein [Nitrosopumilus sp.]MDH3832560.1 phage tail protein [Nitrosopumilus sp.]